MSLPSTNTALLHIGTVFQTKVKMQGFLMSSQ